MADPIDRFFYRKAKSHALCRTCGKRVHKGEPLIGFHPRISGSRKFMAFHPDCFPEKGEINRID